MSVNLTELNLTPEAIAGWTAFASSELFPVITKELEKRGYGRQLNGLVDVFIFIVYTLFICGCLNQATIWVCETVFSRDIDGDGVKGKPAVKHELRPRRGSACEGGEEVEITGVSISVGRGSDTASEHSHCSKESGCEGERSSDPRVPTRSL